MTRVAIAGLGAIGRVLARKLADGMPGLTLACAAARDRAKAQAWLDAERIACPLVEPEDFPAHADLAIECAPAAVLERICRPMLEAGKQVMVLSAGALLPRPELIELAKAHGGQIIVPTGALLGLDAVTAAAEGPIHSVRMMTRKPPHGLAGAPYLEANGISVEGLNEPKRVFSGTARDGGGRVSRQRQRGGGALARRHRAGPHHDRDLGRPHGRPQLPYHRGRQRFRPLHPHDRERPLGEPEDRAGSPRCRCWRRCASSRPPLRVGT